eukprot:CAMPEP_0181199066 /NCGR_PEP_ID=MMETSP1096-20121128/16974_1 /TAXON_ID=156174 ORGANISM="Chrysochromulina ericina, Strain CCMP281" /NCGR_SAMPLE_ID=MMETSP1096 /ASSEMBLY_ACC=CAM_ASM_000453 /LENGTH=217 /DNA_ID=CAMNT_0023289215 /DNA_START=499 /DNA_END=1148 /DNA_ORIENTATION=+
MAIVLLTAREAAAGGISSASSAAGVVTGTAPGPGGSGAMELIGCHRAALHVGAASGGAPPAAARMQMPCTERRIVRGVDAAELGDGLLQHPCSLHVRLHVDPDLVQREGLLVGHLQCARGGERSAEEHKARRALRLQHEVPAAEEQRTRPRHRVDGAERVDLLDPLQREAFEHRVVVKQRRLVDGLSRRCGGTRYGRARSAPHVGGDRGEDAPLAAR